MPGPLDISEAGPLDITYPPDGIPRATPSNNSVGTDQVVDGSIAETDLTAAVQAKLNRTDQIERRLRPFFVCDFLVATAATSTDPFTASAVASGTIASPNITNTNHPGILRILSSTTTNSGYNISTNAIQFLLSGGEVYEAIFYIDALANNTTRLGFHDAGSSSDAVDGCYIEIDGSGVATGKTSNNSTRSSTATTASLSAATWYHARITLNSDATLVTFEIYNDAGTLVWSNTLSTNIPKTSGREVGAGFIITNSGTTAITLAHLDYMAVKITRTLVRGATS